MRQWDELTNKEQKEAVSLLHIAEQLFLRNEHTDKEKELLEVAINHVNAERRKFK